MLIYRRQFCRQNSLSKLLSSAPALYRNETQFYLDLAHVYTYRDERGVTYRAAESGH